MEVTLPISSLIIIAIGSVGVTFSIFMGIMLLNQKEKKHVSIILLGCLLILSGLTLLNDLLVTSGISNRVKSLYFIPIYYSLSIAPLFYLIVKSKFRYRLEKSDFVHLIIPVLQAIVYFSIGFQSVSFKSMIWQNPIFRTYLMVESFLFSISLVIYTLLSLWVLKQENTTAFFWSEDIKRWLSKFAIGMLWIAGMEFCFSIIEYSSILPNFTAFPIILIHSFTLSAFVFWISFNGLKQYFPLQIFTSRPKQESQLIGDQELAELSQKLYSLMSKDKIYLNADLNLEVLAKYLGISEKLCSYVLNKGVNSNFNTFINTYRIEEFKEKIKAGLNKTYTLTSIAYECGFDSKSTFNRVFKLSSGITPTDYVKLNQSSQDNRFE